MNMTALKNARLKIGLRQEDIATEIGVNRSAICRIEKRVDGSPLNVVRYLQAVKADPYLARKTIARRMGVPWEELAAVLGFEPGEGISEAGA